MEDRADGLSWYEHIPVEHFYDSRHREHVCRFAGDKDLPAILQMYQTYTPKKGILGLPPADPESLDKWVRRFFAGERKNIVVMDPDGTVIGHAAVIPTDTESCEYFMALLPTEQHAGVGCLLMESVIETVRYMNKRRLWIVVDRQNIPVIRLHRRRGFEFRGEATDGDVEMELILSPSGRDGDRADGKPKGRRNSSGR
ncbi:MAG: GNAT family N-acetyltransferase [Deltaproteobacteria bacterium]|nr:GNAT family N-acetyltransferase [Candidatus Zymogenaceae bacterium]